jgi:hypothetical protein
MSLYLGRDLRKLLRRCNSGALLLFLQEERRKLIYGVISVIFFFLFSFLFSPFFSWILGVKVTRFVHLDI